jgi:anaerobic selenocysteine-containing dehydrogenase
MGGVAGRDEFVRTACPRDCYDTCGIVVVRRAGAVHAVRGDPSHPVSRGSLCGKCSTAYNREWRDPAVRLTVPQRRCGPKGSGRYEPVSWDEALGDIAARLRGIVASHGAASILNAHYTGTISLLAGIAPMRFFNRLGATEVSPDTICNMAGHAALRSLYGTSLEGFDPRTAADSACLVVWGANPHASAPHAHEYWIPECPGRLVVVDPVRTPTAAKADIHLQPFPGTDAALAFGLAHVMWREGLLDLAFIAAHVVGWDEVEPGIAAANPAWCEAVTGVPAAQVEAVARLYARGPSLLWLGQGLQRQALGGNVMRACAMLPALTGNLARPGAGLLYLNGDLSRRGIDETTLCPPPPATAPPALSHMDLAAALEDPVRAQAFFVWNMNPLASCPQQARLREALRREDLLTVVVDLFATDTAALADYRLPAASFLEFDDIIAPYFQLALSAQVKVMEPPGEALPNLEIFRRLDAAMGQPPATFAAPDAVLLDTLVARAGVGADFREFAARGTVFVPAAPAVQFADLEFATPSGRIELASAAVAALGLPRAPFPGAEPRPQGARLRLLSPAHDWLMNTSFGNVAKIVTRIGAATIALHPADARARGLHEDQPVRVHNATGQITLRVALDPTLPRGVALSHKGRWMGPGAGGANINVLNDGRKSDMGESSAVHSVEVELTPLP